MFEYSKFSLFYMTVINHMHTHSTSWKVTACPSGPEYLNLMLSKTDQDICASLPIETEDRQQKETFAESTHNHKQAVWIHTDKQAYATQDDITLVAVTEGPEPLYFHWLFGDGAEIKTTSRAFTKRYQLPDKFNVKVSMSDGLTSVSSDVYPLVVQRAVRPNRLLHPPSVLLNSTVSFICRISSGTDVSYHWNFGDGTERDGSGIEHHIYNRTGEYVVEVIMSNLVSTTSLTGHIFVVEESCQPPMVKNMGPNKIQVWRYQNVHLAVTFEAHIQCNVSRGLMYRWTVYDTRGQPVLISHTETDRQYLELPKYFLHYGTYKAIAKVQVAGNVVYSNYSVGIEVMLTHPFTLTVYSRNRSSTSEVFITVTSKQLRKMHMSCTHCCGNSVNWNEQFSIFALCYECDSQPQIVTYNWKLYLVNASSKVVTEAPFFSIVDLGLPAKIKENLPLYQVPVETPYTEAPFTEPSIPASLSPYLLSNNTDISSSVAPNILASEIYTTPHTIKAYTQSPNTNMIKQSSFPTDPSLNLPFLEETESSGGQWEYGGPLPPSDRVSLTDVNSDYDYYNFGIEEADPGMPLGRPTDSSFHSYDNEGDNLVDPSLLGQAVSEKTLLDLHRELIHQTVSESNTLTGFSSSVVTFKPFTLKPMSLYMLEVSASYEGRLQGKSQLFFHTQAVPEGMRCQIQPSTGSEIHTHFSIFCSSGKEDLMFEYSYRVGNSPRRLLYEGRDFQHYFNLPSGDPDDDYKVTAYVEIKNRFGATTKRSPVNVTVLPSFQMNSSSQLSPDQELYIYGIGNLTGLHKIGSNRDIINYIHLLTTVLNRLSLSQEFSADLLTLTRSALISSICQLTITDQGILLETIRMLTDLIKISSQVMFDSANKVFHHVQNISSILHESKPPAGYLLDIKVVNALVSLLSGVLDAPVLSIRPGQQLINKVLHTITDLVLSYMLSNDVPQYNMSATSMKALVWTIDHSRTTVKSFGLTTFHLTDFLEMQFQQWNSNYQHKPCVITWITEYRQSPYRWARTPSQLDGDTADIRLYSCTTKKEIKVRHLATPVTITFQRRAESNQSRHAGFALLRSRVNTHQFNVTQKILQRALHITVRFNRPAERPFPILLLLRMYDQPTPKLYNEKKMHQWKSQTAHIFLPGSSLRVAGTVYLMLLSADYNESPGNKYIVSAVNYTINIESVECLSWDGVRAWKSDGCFTHGGVSPDKINCSCMRLTSFAVSHQKIISSYNSADVSQFINSNTNYTLIIVSVMFLTLYVVVLVISTHTDVSMQKTTGSFLLPENNPLDQFLYAVTIQTGFRSRTKMTARVHIVLYGDDGVSQTRELSSTDSKLFTCNSRNTFILSTPESLGRVWKVHLWHDNGGLCPSWFLSHVVVRDLVQGSCWFFLGQCWLAVDEGDGKVERILNAAEHSLTFKQFLHLKLTEYLGDFHPWLSAYSCPSYSSYTHVQRLSVCTLLLQGYMCVGTMLINLLEEQHFLEMGLIDVSPVSMVTGLCSVLAVMPVGSLVSLVFRVRKTNISKNLSEEQYRVNVPDVYSVEDHHDALLINDCTFETNLSHRWTRGSWRKEYKNWKTSDSVSASKRQEDADAIIEIVDDNRSDFNNRSHVKSKQNQSDLRSCTSADVQENQQFCVRMSNLKSWCYYLGWTLCISLSLMSIIITSTLGIRFSRTKALLWIHSVFCSLVCCGFVLHPAMILIIAITVSLLHRERPDWFHSLSVKGPVTELLRHRDQNIDNVLFNPYQQGRITQFEKVLAARQRARYLRLVRPPNSRTLKSVRGQIKKRTLLHKTARDLMLHLIMLSLILFVTYGKSDNDHKYPLNQAITTYFTKSQQNSFHSIQNHDDWWNWTSTTFLERLYHKNNGHDKRANIGTEPLRGAYSLTVTPVIKKIESTYNSSSQILNLLGKSSSAIRSQTVDEDLSSTVSISSSNDQSVIENDSLCGKLGCYEGKGVSVSLGKTRSQVMQVIEKLQTTGWMTRFTHVVRIQFLLHNAPTNLFTSVSIVGERTPTGALMPSTTVQSTRLHHFPAALDYSVMTCEVAVIICGLLRYACSVYHSMLKAEMIDFLQRVDFKLHVDLSPILFCEKLSLAIHGIVVNLLLLKCVLFLRLNKTAAAAVSALKHIFSSLLWLLAPGVIVALAASCLWNLILNSFLSTSITGFVDLFFSRSSLMDHFSNQTKSKLHFGVLFCAMIPLKAVVIVTLTIFVKQIKRTTKRKDITVFDLISCIRNKALLLIGKGSQIPDCRVHTNSFYLEEFEDLMDELLFHLCSMSENVNTLPAKENVFETQSTFSFPNSRHDPGSDSGYYQLSINHADFDVTFMSGQTNKFEELKHLKGEENTLRYSCCVLFSPLEYQMPPYLNRRKPQEIHSKGLKHFRSKRLNGTPAECKDMSSEMLFDTARTGDNRSNVQKSDILTQMKRNTPSCVCLMYCLQVEGQTNIPGYIEQYV
ncbi:putative polycystic kidney disease protein 1-like 1 [Triplophysa rosa]|uniref:Polycystic kidney disease protein 1-like 1 n=1 Tax=Triplophysa rosa TaxID=992332 RepID=A0A9W7T9P2_TRIRA|nr:putative polycystic kidney disease protein 1-like 1 [Triplophysa rosa]